MKTNTNENIIIVIIITVAILFITGLLFGIPAFGRYQKIQNAKTELESQGFLKQVAKAEAEAEVEKAKGVAEANRIIGEGLNNNENYLKYLYITSLKDSTSEKIYIPTEAGLPILEARNQ